MIKRAISLLLASTFIASGAPAQSNAGAQDAPPIIVYGESLKDSDRDLQACIRSKCATDKDVAATLRHAENLFIAGEYATARRTLLASRRRNQRFSKEYPIQVANLLRANARVAEHLGEGEAARLGTLDVLSALKSGLPDDHPRVLGARVELADSLARNGRIEAADMEYRAVARRGKELGLATIEGYGLLRLAAMYTALAETDPGTYRLAAKRAVETLINNGNPGLTVFANAGRVIKARSDFRSGDRNAVDALISSFQLQSAQATPTLLYTPNIATNPSVRDGVDLGVSGNGTPLLGTDSAVQQLAVNNFEGQWVDIGFWVGADGKVRDAAIMRESERLSKHWIGPVLASINGRRYAPIALQENDPGIFRIERYTYTSQWTTRTGSNIRVRGAQPRIEMLDLSPVAGKPATENGPVPAREQRPA